MHADSRSIVHSQIIVCKPEQRTQTEKKKKQKSQKAFFFRAIDAARIIYAMWHVVIFIA